MSKFNYPLIYWQFLFQRPPLFSCLSISDDDDNDGSDFIRLHPVVEENKNEVGGNDDDIKNREEEGKKKKSDERTSIDSS
jgi:hypothetical protein